MFVDNEGIAKGNEVILRDSICFTYYVPVDNGGISKDSDILRNKISIIHYPLVDKVDTAEDKSIVLRDNISITSPFLTIAILNNRY